MRQIGGSGHVAPRMEPQNYAQHGQKTNVLEKTWRASPPPKPWDQLDLFGQLIYNSKHDIE